ncbi:MAG TPA: hypothetical protein VMQ83_07215 [Gammaproteobacteria bacterium]|nr:hypothetical protein [Gammaproteobacteria bacterium]
MRMGEYRKVAVLAAESIREGVVPDPADAWAIAARKVFPASSALQNKGCPKGAFLGLCNRGMIDGIPAGKYSGPSKNGEYAVAAVEILRTNRFLTSQPKLLWKKVAGNSKTENGQMSVVIGLWEANVIRE